MTVKTLIGYEIVAGISVVDYDTWIRDVHVPDLLANPYADGLVFNTVIEPVTQASGGSMTIPACVSMFSRSRDPLRRRERIGAGSGGFAAHPVRRRGPGRPPRLRRRPGRNLERARVEDAGPLVDHHFDVV